MEEVEDILEDIEEGEKQVAEDMWEPWDGRFEYAHESLTETNSPFKRRNPYY